MKRVFTGLVITICFFELFISCSKDNNNDPVDPSNVETFLTKETIKEMNNGTLYTDVSLYFYDNSKRLLKIVRESGHSKGSSEVDYIYNTDGTLNKTISSNEYVESYYYENNNIVYVIYSGSYGSDTLFLYYNNDGKIQRTTHNRNHSIYSGKVFETIDYSLDVNGIVTKRIVNFKNYDGEYNLWEYFIDTTLFLYSPNGNLTSYIKNKYNMLTDERTWYKYEYEYDSKLNYWTTKHLPKEELFIEMLFPDNDFAKNNTILTTYASSTGDYEANIRNINSYNSKGYPLLISANWGSIELEYSDN